MRIEDLFKENSTEADQLDETWKIAFFNDMELSEVVLLANLANYLNIPQLLDSCLEVIAIEMRNVTRRAAESEAVKVTPAEDKKLREKYNWAYN